jgi:TRAP-type C4-dicarboxylate transport system permease large subunit
MFPIARDVGVHEVHYAMIAILAMGVGLFAPPFGHRLLRVVRVRRLRAGSRTAAHLDLSGGALIGLVVVAAVPWILIGFL